MKQSRTRLDRFLAKRLGVNSRLIKRLLVERDVVVNGERATDVQQLIDEFTRVEIDGELIQAKQPVYIQLHKPKGVVSATQDAKHTTVLDLIVDACRTDLHLVGRLDFNSTGLVLLTNDSRWSRRITDPEAGIEKHYRVTLDKPATSDVISAFKQGIYFNFEKITTRPVRVSLLEPTCVELFLHEGRYHQIKRMFGHFQITVLSLHRLAIGKLVLDPTLLPGQWRALTECEALNLVSDNQASS